MVIFAGVEGVVYRARKGANVCNVCFFEGNNLRAIGLVDLYNCFCNRVFFIVILSIGFKIIWCFFRLVFF